jgi:predicted MPP superfamily phosphohydrolase
LVVIIAAVMMTVGLGLDNRIQVSEYVVTDGRVPESFDGFRIAQLSDIHCRWFGDGQSELLSAVRAGKPDIIVLTGDILDAYILDYDSVAALFDGLTKIAPCYAVSGNHERNTKGNLKNMEELYARYGVSFLKDSGTTVSRGGSEIYIYGLDDRSRIVKSIPKAAEDTFGILLFHRSDLFDSVSYFGYGLVFSGHTHGGLIRLPFVGGIISPDATIDFHQKYTGGLYTAGTTTLIANRGMADSHNVPRVFNRPEVVFATLRAG